MYINAHNRELHERKIRELVFFLIVCYDTTCQSRNNKYFVGYDRWRSCRVFD